MESTCKKESEKVKMGNYKTISEKKKKLLNDCLNLSSGTIATLTGLRSYSDIEKVQNKFVAFVKDSRGHYKNWQFAWRAFVKKKLM